MPSGDSGKDVEKAKDFSNPPPWVTKFIDLQTQELQERAEDRKLRAQTDQNQFELAKLSIDAQERTITATSSHDRGVRRDLYILITGAILIIGAIVVFALWKDKDQFAMEILRAIIFLGSGGVGGYAVGRHKKNEDDEES